jgi:ketosteroid isomerase-like protein
MSNVDHLRDLYARYSRRDFGIVDDSFAADIAWNIVGLVDVTGRDAVRAFFEGLTEQFESHTITLDDSVEDGGRLVAFVHHTFTRNDGEQGTVQAVHDWRFEDGMAVSLREIADSMSFAVISGQIQIPA